VIYNQLGDSELVISSLGLGTMSFDCNQPKEAIDLLQYAFEKGINYIDTADLYDKGQNEEVVGQAIKSFRKDIVLATKVGNKWRADGSGWDWDVSSSYIKQAIDVSLKRLQTDYIDLYQVHGGTNQDNVESIVETMETLVAQGKIRYYGISSIRPNVFLKYCAHTSIVSNMMQYSILDNRPENYLADFVANQVSIIARGALAQGLLINKQAKPYLTYSASEVEEVHANVKECAKASSVNEIAVALQYVLQKAPVASALVGVRTKQQLNEILAAYAMIKDCTIDLSNLNVRKINYQEHLI